MEFLVFLDRASFERGNHKGDVAVDRSGPGVTRRQGRSTIVVAIGADSIKQPRSPRVRAFRPFAVLGGCLGRAISDKVYKYNRNTL